MRSPIYEDAQAKAQKAVGVLKRLIRRKGAYPFILATVEPRTDAEGRLVAMPVVVDRGIAEPQARYLVDALLRHLAQVGAIRAAQEPAADVQAGGEEGPK